MCHVGSLAFSRCLSLVGEGKGEGSVLIEQEVYEKNSVLLL